MRRGPAIGGHLPRIKKTDLEQMPLLEQAAYFRNRAEILGKRAMFFLKIAIVFLVLSVIFQIVRVAVG